MTGINNPVIDTKCEYGLTQHAIGIIFKDDIIGLKIQ